MVKSLRSYAANALFGTVCAVALVARALHGERVTWLTSEQGDATGTRCPTCGFYAVDATTKNTPMESQEKSHVR